MDCSTFDAQVVRPTGRLETLMSHYVRVRITNMKDVDIGLFDFDFDTTFALVALNAKEQVYFRYGGRDDRSPTSHLTIEGLKAALSRGLDLHEAWKKKEVDLPPRPPEKLATSYARVRKIVKKGKCVHCHNISHARAETRLKDPDFQKKSDVWLYPDPRRLGLHLDTADGAVLKRVKGAAKRAGLKKGDVLKKAAGRRVLTFTDVQYTLHRLPRDAKSVPVTVERNGKTKALEVKTPDHWRVTDIYRRSIGHVIEPFPGFWSKPLTTREKKRLRLPEKAFASRVTKFWVNTNGKKAGLRKGDIVLAVNGTAHDPLARNVAVHIRLHYKTGDRVKLDCLRGRKRFEAAYRLKRKPW